MVLKYFEVPADTAHTLSVSWFLYTYVTVLDRISILQMFSVKRYLLPSSCTQTRDTSGQKTEFYLYQFSQSSHNNDISRTKKNWLECWENKHILLHHMVPIFPEQMTKKWFFLQSRSLMLHRRSRLPPKNNIFKIKCPLCNSEALNGSVSRQSEQKQKLYSVMESSKHFTC